MRIFGIVRQVSQKCYVVSLPFGMNGVLPFSEVSDSSEITELNANQYVNIGDFLMLSVVKVESVSKSSSEQSHSSSRIVLSCKPSVINKSLTITSVDVVCPYALVSPLAICHHGFSKGTLVLGSVTSVEDHGYVVATEISKLKCFIPFEPVDLSSLEPFSLPKSVRKSLKSEHESPKLSKGQIVLAGITKFNKDLCSAILDARPSLVRSIVTSGSGMTIQTIQPGYLVPAIVESVTPRGISVGFHGFFHGWINVWQTDVGYLLFCDARESM